MLLGLQLFDLLDVITSPIVRQTRLSLALLSLFLFLFNLSPPPTTMLTSQCAGLRVAVIGASLGGLSAASVLHRRGAIVSVYNCFDSGFHRRGGALGAVDVDLVRISEVTTEERDIQESADTGTFMAIFGSIMLMVCQKAVSRTAKT